MPDDSDLAWLGLERHGDGRWSFELTSGLTRHDGKLFGGTGIAVTVATMEAETGRDALWTTVQYASSAELGARIDCHVEVLASGKRTSQLRMTATDDDRIVLAAVGATGAARVGPIEAQIPAMPAMPPPDECASMGVHAAHARRRSPAELDAARRDAPRSRRKWHLGAYALWSAHARDDRLPG